MGTLLQDYGKSYLKQLCKSEFVRFAGGLWLLTTMLNGAHTECSYTGVCTHNSGDTCSLVYAKNPVTSKTDTLYVVD